MKSLLSPLIAFLNSISYKAKFLLIGSIVFMYTSFLVYENFAAAAEDIEFSQKEVYGVELLPSTHDLLLATQNLRGITAAYLSGDTTLKPKVDELQNSVNEKLQTFEKAFSTTELEGFDALVTEIKSTLTTTMATSMSSKESFKSYTDIVAKQLDLIVLIGDNSNLILDPDIDSFYMMDAVINKLPQIFENVGKDRGLSASILAKKSITSEEISNISSFTISAFKDMHSLESGFQSAYEKNNAIKEILDAKKKVLSTKIDSFKELINSHVLVKQDMEPLSVFTQGTDVLHAADSLYMVTLDVLTELLNKRVSKLQSHENFLIGAASIFSLFLASLFMAFYHSVSGTISSMVRQLKEIETDKNLSKDIVIDTKDELKDIATAYNALRASIQSTMYDALGSVQSSTNHATQMLSQSQEIDINSKRMSETISQLAGKGEDIKHNLENSKEIAQNSKEQITAAYETLQKATHSIQNLATQVEESSHKEMEMADKINQLSQDASDVKNVLSVINDIAEQTNLLALNAAIEAARAGEHGRGFAVVADEVRQLAEKTQKSLSEINATINIIMQNISDASTEMNSNAKSISAMTATSDTVLSEVEWVNTIMNEATKLIEESSKSIEENAKGVDLIAKDLKETDNLAIENSAKIATISESSSALASKVNEIKMRVGAFEL